MAAPAGLGAACPPLRPLPGRGHASPRSPTISAGFLPTAGRSSGSAPRGILIRPWRRCSPTSAASRRSSRSPRTARPSCRCWAAITAPTSWPEDRGSAGRPRGDHDRGRSAARHRPRRAAARLAPRQSRAAKSVMAALLEGASVRLTVEAGDRGAGSRARACRSTRRSGSEILVTHRAVTAHPGCLAYHPPVLALGVGCGARSTARSAGGPGPARLLAEAGLAREAVACIVSIDLKADEPAVHALAATLGVPARFFEPRGCWPRPPASHPLRGRRFARPAAGAWPRAPRWRRSAGPGATLLVPKRKRRARHLRHRPGAAGARSRHGRAPAGSLTVIGIGPGDPAWRTREAERRCATPTRSSATASISTWSATCSPGAVHHRFRARAEERALPLGARPRRRGPRRSRWSAPAIPGIYAMAALVFELLDSEAEPRVGARRRRASSRHLGASGRGGAPRGAPLGHDFCAISLSDLLTPWPVIERRLRAAAAGDFVVALYNPVSARTGVARLERAKEILAGRTARPDARDPRPQPRPRADERCTRHQPRGARRRRGRHADPRADRQQPTRRLRRRIGRDCVYTPRGYARRVVTVHFIGAGPGAPDLITVRGRALIRRCPVCLYAGSLVPAEVVAEAPAGARVVDTAPLTSTRSSTRWRGRTPGEGRRPRPFRRSLDLRRHRRADAPARRARHPWT